MVKLIIVDDDSTERFSLRNYIDWSLIGVEVVGDTWNGMQAIDLVITLKPDIVLSDIRMPVMDGLEMAKKIKAIEPRTKIILCSAHGDFSYAQEAVNINAFGYILKPARDEELLKMVKKAADKHIEECMQGVMVEKLKNNVTASVTLMREATVREFLLGNVTNKDEISRSVGLEWIFEPCGANGLLLVRWAKNNNISSECIKELGKAILADSNNFTQVRFSLNEVVILLRISGDSSRHDEYMQNLCKQAEAFMKEKGGANVCVVYSIGSFEDGSFKSMLSDANDKIELSWSRLVLNELSGTRSLRNKPTSVSAKMEATDVSSIILKNDLSKAFRDADENSLRSLISNYFHQVLEDRSSSSDWYEQGLIVLSMIVSVSKAGGYNPFSGIDEEINHWTTLLNMKSLEGIQEHLVECAISIVRSYNHSVKDKADFIIVQIERIVERHYSEPLTVEQIANMLHFSPNYLGSIFKAKRKISLSEYITKYRICKSMELLRGYSFSIVDIAQLCGYENIPYFHTMFKKYIGLTPNQYRQMIKWTPNGDEND